MDRTRVPVELPDPTRAAWKRHLDDLAGLDVASARFRADLEELHPADHKPGTGFPAQVSRFVRGNGEEILSWLKPDNAHGDALCDALDTTREALWAWLQDRLSPPATGAALRADDLALLPRRATGPDLSSAESRERLLSDGSMSSQGVTRLSLGQHLFGPPLPTRTDRLDAWSALLTALAQESRRPVVVIGGAEVGPFAPVDPDPAAAPPGPSLEVELRLLPEGPEDVDGWLTRLVERARLRPEQADRARATLVDPWRRSPDLLPREVASCADLARLVDDAANDRLGPLTPRSLRERIARWRRDDALRCATSEATRAWLESAEDLLLEHLIATGAFEAPRPAAAVAHALRPEADGRRITDVDAVLRALRSSEEVRLQAAADLARANHRELLDQLRRDGLLEDAPDQSEPHLRLGPVLVGLARAACPLRLTAAQAARLAVHPEGQALIREAVLCATDLAAWVDVALTADLPHNPHLAAAVARGLAGHPDLAPGLLERLWASLVWMVLHGMGTFEGGGWRNPYGALLEELSKAWRDRLPLLAGPNPYGALRARVPPEVRACVARWRPEPPDAPWPAPPAELWSQRTRHWAGPWEAAAESMAPWRV